MTCNSNVSVLLPRPIPIYTTKYQTKSTQDDDTDDYKRVYEATQKTLTKQIENDQSESTQIQIFNLLGQPVFEQNIDISLGKNKGGSFD